MRKLTLLIAMVVLGGCAQPHLAQPSAFMEGPEYLRWKDERAQQNAAAEQQRKQAITTYFHCVWSTSDKLALSSRDATELVATAAVTSCAQGETALGELYGFANLDIFRGSAMQIAVEHVVFTRANAVAAPPAKNVYRSNQPAQRDQPEI